MNRQMNWLEVAAARRLSLLDTNTTQIPVLLSFSSNHATCPLLSICLPSQYVVGAAGVVEWRARLTAPGTLSGKLATWNLNIAPLPRPVLAPTTCGSSVTAVASCAASSLGSWSSTQSLWWCSWCFGRLRMLPTACSMGWSSTASPSSPSPRMPRRCAQTRLVMLMFDVCLCVIVAFITQGTSITHFKPTMSNFQIGAITDFYDVI